MVRGLSRFSYVVLESTSTLHKGKMGHGIAVTPEVAKKVLWACLAMPVVALGARLFMDPTHEAQTHHEDQLPIPPHVPPPVADFPDKQHQSAESS